MSNRGVLNIGVAVGFLLLFLSSVFPDPARAAWVNSTGTQFQVGGNLRNFAPNLAGTSGFLDPTCVSGTSLALVPGLKLFGVDPVQYPIVLVVSCLDSAATAIRSRLNFISPVDGKVIKQISTFLLGGTPTAPFAPSNGWAHLIHRPDKGDLLGCGGDGSLYSIDFSQATSITDGTATPLSLPPGVTSCKGLAWDAEAEMIYQDVSATTQNRVVRFKEGTTSLLGDFTIPCASNGLAISGGVLLLSCNVDSTIRRLDKNTTGNTGISLGVHGTLSPLAAFGPGGLACDPVTFHKDGSGRDLFTDALWSRQGATGNAVVALEFPAYTCGMPSKSVVNGFSPLAAGLSAPGTASQPGVVPLTVCFDGSGMVIDADRDGIPDCWEETTASSGIDFNGDGTNDLRLCAFVDTSGDGIPDTTECADPRHRDLFVEIDWMQNHKPDPKALSQTQNVASVGVKSVREAFAAAPVQNPLSTASPQNGIRIHFQVDEQVTFLPFGESATTSHVDRVAFTPCTGPASAGAISPFKAVDFDVVKAANFGTATERGDANNANILNAKRLAFRYVLFAHNLVGNPSGGSSGSGCAEVGGDDAVITLGSFAATNVVTDSPPTHNRGTTDQQAGTFMHEFGHLLGLRHGGIDGNNCKPNYRSVMNYTRQFSGSPIANRRLDYSRSADPYLPSSPQTTPGVLKEGSLFELDALGSHPSLGPIPVYFPSADRIAFGPNAWSLVAANAADINWNRNLSGKNPNYESSAVSANINSGATTGCDGVGTDLVGHDDWSNILYRSSAAVDFAGARSNDDPVEITSENEQAFFLEKDVDGNGIGDGIDCGTFTCTHRMDTPKGIKRTGNFEIVIFSEKNGSQVWDAPAQVRKDDTLTISLESVMIPAKTNKGKGTCAAKDIPDPTTGQKDGIKDLHCQVHVTGITLPTGTLFAIVSGFFFDPLTKTDRAFSARQLVTIVE